MGWKDKIEQGLKDAVDQGKDVRRQAFENAPRVDTQSPPVAEPAPTEPVVDDGEEQGQEEVEYDKKDQLEKTQADLIPGEVLYAVYDMKGGGTGFVGITDRRLIIQDQAFLRKQKSLVSIPFSKITAVASEDSGKIMFGASKLMILAGAQEYEFEFRSNEKAHNAYRLILTQTLQGELPG